MEDVGGDRFDVIVVGAGIMGSCTAYAAAKRGKRVLVLEQFDLHHHLGSSHGFSRTIRATYAEDYYSSMAMESYALWEEVQAEAGYRVLNKTKQLDMGPADSGILRAVIANCESAAFGPRVLDQAGVVDEFAGALELPEGWIGVVSDVGGIIKPTEAVTMFQALAVRRGAVLKNHMQVEEIKKEEGGSIRVSTGGGQAFWGNKCVVTVGAWTRKLVKSVCGLELPVQPLHTTICYWRIKDGYEKELSLEGGFQTFMSYGEPCIYGTPTMELPGLIKVAVHGGEPCDPDRRDWTRATMEGVGAWIARVMGGGVEHEKPAMTQPCMYPMTPDEDYVIDFLEGQFGKDVVVAGGFSGHGFKMAPVIGRVLAELAVDGKLPGWSWGTSGWTGSRDAPMTRRRKWAPMAMHRELSCPLMVTHTEGSCKFRNYFVSMHERV